MQSKIKVLSMRSVSVFSILLIGGILLLYRAVQAEMPPLLAMDGQKIVTASTVRYRVQPSLDAEVIGHVALGAVLSATRRTREPLQNDGVENYWYLVDVEDKQGWVSGQFLRDFKLEQKEKIWFSIIRERMDNPDLTFIDRVALYQFVDAIVSKKASDESDSVTIDSDKMSSAFELGRILALQKAFDKVNWENAQSEPHQLWVQEHETAKRVFYDEISGQWLVPVANYWKLADKYKGQQGGDEISWYAANAQLGGECEGDIECDLNRELMTHGEYLQRYPYGRYAGKSLKRLSATFDYIQQMLEREPGYFQRSPGSGEVIGILFETIASSNPKLTERATAFKQIKAIRRTFRQQ